MTRRIEFRDQFGHDGLAVEAFALPERFETLSVCPKSS
jgi:hypothetical protein